MAIELTRNFRELAIANRLQLFESKGFMPMVVLLEKLLCPGRAIHQITRSRTVLGDSWIVLVPGKKAPASRQSAGVWSRTLSVCGLCESRHTTAGDLRPACQA